MPSRGNKVTGLDSKRGEPPTSEGNDTRAEGPVLLKTREVLAAAGISHQTLYRYVTLGLIQETETTAGGQRLFHPDVVELVEQIKELNERYSLRDIKEIFFKEFRVRRALRGKGENSGRS